jgi:hypothetical protein
VYAAQASNITVSGSSRRYNQGGRKARRRTRPALPSRVVATTLSPLYAVCDLRYAGPSTPIALVAAGRLTATRLQAQAVNEDPIRLRVVKYCPGTSLVHFQLPTSSATADAVVRPGSWPLAFDFCPRLL